MIKKILLVDDDPDFLNLTLFILKKKGFEIVTATSGQEALALLEKETFDLILSDVSMPNGDGLFLFNEIKKPQGLTPFIFLTGHIDQNQEHLFHEAKGILRKPFSIQELMDLISKLEANN